MLNYNSGMMYKLSYALLAGTLLFSSCGDDDEPPAVNPEEEITRVELTFTNVADGSDVVSAVWLDEDGDGGQDPTIEPIVLDASKTYDMDILFTNTLETPPEDITEEVEEEADEHMIFFAFTDNIFADPAGNGNADNRDDDVNYNDQDSNGFPLGLSTTWSTGDADQGTFRVILKHQPDIKSATSTSADGETDVDITYDLIIQ
jgi:hypothetical protein